MNESLKKMCGACGVVVSLAAVSICAATGKRCEVVQVADLPTHQLENRIEITPRQYYLMNLTSSVVAISIPNDRNLLS